MIRKTLAISILLALLLLLGGCDAMLEFFYPEFKNSYEVEVQVTIRTDALFWEGTPNKDVYLVLYKDGMPLAAHIESGQLFFGWLFSDLEPGSYTVEAYWDKDGSGSLNDGDAFYTTLPVSLTDESRSHYFVIELVD